MRDALSILDKIVSFTNGEVTYQNTLEHLNILDADYYFKLIEAMQQQHLADALLLFDGINRKGFEGDLVLNGFAEFIRNLLVCKDEKAAGLLEVVESFKEKYLATAKKANIAYLIGALNVLNEAELNYKAARNKRLHVELALIKLCYLQQALELVANGEVTGKKKLTESAKPVAFRNLKPIGVSPGRSEQRIRKQETGGPGETARLLIHSDQIKGKTDPEEFIGSGVSSSDLSPETSFVQSGSATNTTGTLSKIRQQIASRQEKGKEDTCKPLQQESLQQAWHYFSRQLQENKSSAAQSFQRAVLNIIDQNTFEVLTNNNLEQKFIEQEKRNLSDYLQRAFNNKALSFVINISKKSDKEELIEKTLSKREQYQLIIEQYPLVKELKDKLRLELDY
jgi:DNA polymerase-3 subunit gamma/tau